MKFVEVRLLLFVGALVTSSPKRNIRTNFRLQMMGKTDAKCRGPKNNEVEIKIKI